MIATTDIPLNKLITWDGNVRKTGAENGIAELAASITAHGLLQALVVRNDKRGKFAVVAGQRRFLALKSLAASGRLEPDALVSCNLLDADANATEISLVENILREQMHPADEFEAFRALTDQGLPIPDIAARFGVTESVVLRRLKLARVSPVIIDAYRREALSLEQVMAFAISDDNAAQERVLEALPEWNDGPDTIRDALTENEITAIDRRVTFVTLAVYQEAGGPVRRDLFAEGDGGIFILDPALLDKLVIQKLETVADDVRSEGWKWVEIRSSFDYDEWSECDRATPQDVPLSTEQQEELDRLQQELDALSDVSDEEFTDESQRRCDEIEQRIGDLEDAQQAYMPETLAIAGAVVALDYDGDIDVRRGFVRPEDAPPETIEGADATDGAPSPKKPFLSSVLVESLSAHRSAALSAALMQRPDIALAALVHAFASSVFGGSGGSSSLQVAVFPRSMKRVQDSQACRAIENARQHWGDELRDEDVGLWPWCLAQDKDRLLDLLAFCVALSVDVIQVKNDKLSSRRFTHAEQLAVSLDFDIAEWFTPTAENFFARIPKPQILSALQEAKGGIAPAWASMKKGDLAALAEREITGTGWLPEILRPAKKDDPLDKAA